MIEGDSSRNRERDGYCQSFSIYGSLEAHDSATKLISNFSECCIFIGCEVLRKVVQVGRECGLKELAGNYKSELCDRYLDIVLSSLALDDLPNWICRVPTVIS